MDYSLVGGGEVPEFPSIVGLDTEARGDNTGLINAHHMELTLVQIAFPNSHTYLVTHDFHKLPSFANTLCVGHGLQFDINIFKNVGIELEKCYDTLVVEGLLDAARPPEEKQRLSGKNPYRLDNIVKRYLRETRHKDIRSLFAAGSSLTPDMIEYAVLDATDPLDIRERQLPQLKKYQPSEAIFNLEMNFLHLASKITYKGIRINDEKWEVLADYNSQKVLEIDKELIDLGEVPHMRGFLGGVKSSINFNSPTQIKRFLSENVIAVENTTKPHLMEVAVKYDKKDKRRQILNLLLDRSVAQKAASTYGLKWLNYISPKTGRVHWSIDQTRPETGRMSAYAPNLTNIPRDVRYRESFDTREQQRKFSRRVIIKADYGQQEARINAFISGESSLREAFENNIDPYVMVARNMFGDDSIQKDSPERFVGKTLFLALVYGMGLVKLALSLGVSKNEARHHNDNFRAKLPNTYALALEFVNTAKRLGYAETLLGRRRYGSEEFGGFTGQMRNHPIQGTAADMLKLAALYIDNELVIAGYDAFIINLIHDEVVLESSYACAKEVCILVEKCMLEAAAFLVDIPFLVDVDVGYYWGDNSLNKILGVK